VRRALPLLSLAMSGCLGLIGFDFDIADSGAGPTDGAVPDATIDASIDGGMIDAGPFDGGRDAGVPLECDVDGDGWLNDPGACGRPNDPADCDDGDPDLYPWRDPVCGDSVAQSCALTGPPISLAELGESEPMRITDVTPLAAGGSRQISVLLRPPPILERAPLGAEAAVLWHETDGGRSVARVRAFEIGGTVDAPVEVADVATTISPILTGGLTSVEGSRIARVEGRAVLGLAHAVPTAYAIFFGALDPPAAFWSARDDVPGTDLGPQAFISQGALLSHVRLVTEADSPRIMTARSTGIETRVRDPRIATATWLVGAGRVAIVNAGEPLLWDGTDLTMGGVLVPTSLPASLDRAALARLGDVYVGVIPDDATGGTRVFRMPCTNTDALSSCAGRIASVGREETGRSLFALEPIAPLLAAAAFARTTALGDDVAIGFLGADGTWHEALVHSILDEADVGAAFDVEDIALAAETTRGTTTIMIAALVRTRVDGASSLWARRVTLCASDACVPLECADLGRTCGATDDGCGGTLSCGACTGPCVTGACSASGSCVAIDDETACTDGLGGEVCRGGACVPDTPPLRLSEVCGSPDFIELVSQTSTPTALDGITLSWSGGSYAFEVGATVAGNGYIRLIEAPSLPNEVDLGSEAFSSGDWIALCEGACDTVTCNNFIDYMVWGSPAGIPACASMSSPALTTSISGSGYHRVGFAGSGAMGAGADWTPRSPCTREAM
jgi:hypothetical protein